MKIKPFQGSLLQTSLIEDTPQFLYELKNDFSREIEAQYYLKSEKQSYYIYQIVKNGKSHLGLIVQNDPEDILKHKFLKHELVLPQKFEMIKGMIDAAGTMIKPIMVFHKQVNELNEILLSQVEVLSTTISVIIEEEIHNIYIVIDEKIIESITQLFADRIQEAFIADGHHRYESIRQLTEEGVAMHPPRNINMLSAYFGADMLMILPINRLINLPVGISNSDVKTMLKEIGKVKRIKQLFQPDEKYRFTVALGQKYYKVKIKKSFIKEYKILNDPIFTVEIVESELYKGISRLTSDKMEIDYLIGNIEINTILEKADGVEMIVLLPPIKLKDVKKISRQGRTLPAKSTWFEPKVRSGLIIGKI